MKKSVEVELIAGAKNNNVESILQLCLNYYLEKKNRLLAKWIYTLPTDKKLYQGVKSETLLHGIELTYEYAKNEYKLCNYENAYRLLSVLENIEYEKAYTLIGEVYYFGNGTTIDIDKALKLWENPLTKKSLRLLGDHFYKNNEIEKAIQYYDLGCFKFHSAKCAAKSMNIAIKRNDHKKIEKIIKIQSNFKEIDYFDMCVFANGLFAIGKYQEYYDVANNIYGQNKNLTLENLSNEEKDILGQMFVNSGDLYLFSYIEATPFNLKIALKYFEKAEVVGYLKSYIRMAKINIINSQYEKAFKFLKECKRINHESDEGVDVEIEEDVNVLLFELYECDETNKEQYYEMIKTDNYFDSMIDIVKNSNHTLGDCFKDISALVKKLKEEGNRKYTYYQASLIQAKMMVEILDKKIDSTKLTILKNIKNDILKKDVIFNLKIFDFEALKSHASDIKEIYNFHIKNDFADEYCILKKYLFASFLDKYYLPIFGNEKAKNLCLTNMEYCARYLNKDACKWMGDFYVKNIKINQKMGKEESVNEELINEAINFYKAGFDNYDSNPEYNFKLYLLYKNNPKLAQKYLVKAADLDYEKAIVILAKSNEQDIKNKYTKIAIEKGIVEFLVNDKISTINNLREVPSIIDEIEKISKQYHEPNNEINYHCQYRINRLTVEHGHNNKKNKIIFEQGDTIDIILDTELEPLNNEQLSDLLFTTLDSFYIGRIKEAGFLCGQILSLMLKYDSKNQFLFNNAINYLSSNLDEFENKIQIIKMMIFTGINTLKINDVLCSINELVSETIKQANESRNKKNIFLVWELASFWCLKVNQPLTLKIGEEVKEYNVGECLKICKANKLNNNWNNDANVLINILTKNKIL